MVEGRSPFLLRFGHGPFGAAIPLQHREVQPQPAMHSCYLRSTDKRLYHSHHGMVTDLLPTRIEPWSSAWEANVLATTPPGQHQLSFNRTYFGIFLSVLKFKSWNFEVIAMFKFYCTDLKISPCFLCNIFTLEPRHFLILLRLID